MSNPSVPALPAGALPALLEMLPVGVVCYAPVFDESGRLFDFCFHYLNPGAQRLLGLPERPTRTLAEHFPASRDNGGLAFHLDTYRHGGPAHFEFAFPVNGADHCVRLEAWRVDDLLLATVTDAADTPRTPLDGARRESHSHEAQARAATETERQLLYDVLQQAPVAIAYLEGADFRIQLANPTVCEIWDRPEAELLGRPLLAALPELEGQGVDTLLTGVLRTGQPLHGTELSFKLLRRGQLETVYFDFVYQPQRSAQGAITGVLVVATDVTAQLMARRRIEAQEHQTAELNEELATINEELTAANAESHATNAELSHAQAELRALNEALEARVQERTRAAQTAEAQAQVQRERLERLFQQAPAAICILGGPDLVFELVNPTYQQFFPKRRLLGKSVRVALPELADHAAYHTMRQVFATGEPLWQQALHVPLARTDDGPVEDRYFNYVQQPRYDERGRIDGVIVFGFEVTELVQARQQVERLNHELAAATRRLAQEREGFYQILAQTSACIAILREPAHRFAFANTAYLGLFPGRELLGRTMADVSPEIQEQGFVALLDTVYRTGETQAGYEVPVWLTQPEGPPLTAYYNFAFSAYREGGHIVGVSIFAYEVTEQVLARQEREVQRQQLQAVFEQAPVALFVLHGPTHLLQVVNPPMSEMLGQPVSELLGKPYAEAIPGIADQGYPELLAQVWRTGQPLTMQESPAHLARHQPGEVGYFTFVYQPIFDAAGHVTDIMCVCVDVTEPVLARRQVQDLNQELTATNKELHASNGQLLRTNADLDNFIYTASHDLRAPISNIEGLLHLLEDQLPDELRTGNALQPVLARMHESVERFTRTIAHLTDVSKLQVEFAQPAVPTPLHPVLEDVRQDLQPLFAQTGGQLTVDAAGYPTLQLSEKNLRSIVYNLVSNSLKYHHPDRPPVVHVSCHREGTRHVLRVQDNGLGIAEWQLAKLFQLFERLHTHVEGTGVGLYMVKKMVENAGGTISVHSRVGEGTTFAASFPA